MTESTSALARVLTEAPEALARGWKAEISQIDGYKPLAGDERDAEALTRTLSNSLRSGADPGHFEREPWKHLREELVELARSRAAQGQGAGDTAIFLMALKRPLMVALQKNLEGAAQALFDAMWLVSTLVDKMARVSADAYQVSREQIIRRQQEELLELSTPVVKLWEGVLAVPMIGTLDSNRTQLVMEALLQRIVDTGSELAIIDITGVPTVDTLVAQHLLKTVTAIRLMGADCIISGIRPQIAQTIVHLGIDLQGVVTKATLADALSLAVRKAGFAITREKR